MLHQLWLHSLWEYFVKRVNANGAFAGLIGGLVMAVLLLFFKQYLVGELHFLFIVPILFGLSCLIIYGFSLLYPAPSELKLNDTTFNVAEFKDELSRMRDCKWYDNYLFYSVVLLLLSAVIWIIFS